MTYPPPHFAVPVLDDDGQPAKPYQCHRCQGPLRRHADGDHWHHVREVAS